MAEWDRGSAGDVPLLGVITLEEFGLMLDPFKRTLRPMRMMLARGGRRARHAPDARAASGA